MYYLKPHSKWGFLFVGGWVYLEMDSFKTKFFIVIILLGIFSIIFAFVILGNRLEIISYDLIKENLWLAIPLIALSLIHI